MHNSLLKRWESRGKYRLAICDFNQLVSLGIILIFLPSVSALAIQKIRGRFFEHQQILTRYIGRDAAAGHQDIAARDSTALSQSCHA
jgi:hypothetical protein